MRLLHSFAILASLAPAAFADVKFLTPKAGASIPVGTLQITWEDSGDSPSIDALTTYSLQLMVGGNSDNDAQPLASASNNFVSTGNKNTLVLTAGLSGSTKNGFYLKMISTAADGGTVTNFSDRFTVTGMTGVTPPTYASAAAGIDGTAGPETINNIANNAAPAAGGAAAAGAAGYTVPYALQSGLTKYAPMQSVPPTKITLKNFSPLYPTSAFKIATAALPVATIATTITQSQTFSVQIQENTAAAQAGPSGDMAKFLARWKD